MEQGIFNDSPYDPLQVAPELLKILPVQFLELHRVVPLRLNRHKLILAMANPNNQAAIENARAISGYEIEVSPSSERAISLALNRYFSSFRAPPVRKDLVIDENLASSSSIQKGVEPQVIRVLNRLIELSLEQRASDIHLEPQRKGLFARFRIDGVLTTIHQFPLSIQPALISRVKILAGLDIAEKRVPQDGQFTFSWGEENVGLRTSVLPGNYGEKVVMRILNRSVLQMDLATLEIPKPMKRLLISLIEKPHGLILVTGPTGTGKTTTLYAILKHLVSNFKNIITLEDPIEYELLAHSPLELGITQIQVHPKIGMTFAAGLRSALRQDPDIIMVGEIRDRETAEITMRAVMTGHLVVSTLHTSDASSALARLVDMGIENYLINSSILLVIAQQLVRELCQKCKQAYQPPSDFLKKIFPPNYNYSSATFFQPCGCPHCFETGYFGRRPIMEILPFDNDIRDQMEQDPSIDQLRKRIRSRGVKSLREFGLDLVCHGITSFEEVLRTTSED